MSGFKPRFQGGHHDGESKNLKPCPFCGSPAGFLGYGELKHTEWYVVCTEKSCGAWMAANSPGSDDQEKHDVVEAKWNLRTTGE